MTLAAMVEPVEKKVAETSAKAARSAKVQEKSQLRQERSERRQEESADRRTELAADRTVYAAERTYAAWMRSGLAAMAVGVGARALLKEHIADWLALATSAVLTLFGMFCFIAAVWRELDRRVRPHPDVRRVPAAVTVAFSLFLVLVSGAILVGLWTS